MSKFFSNVIIFLLFLLVFCVIYSPVLYFEYLYHDDINYFIQTPNRLVPPGQKHNFFIGRFIGATLFTLSAKIVNSVNDLWIIRFLSIVQFSLSAFLLFKWLKTNLFKTIHAFLIATAIFLLPPFQVIAGYAGISFHATAILLGLMAALLTDRIALDQSLIKRLLNKYTFFALILNFCALATYPSTATFYWVLFAFIILFKHPTDVSTRLKQTTHFFFVGLGATGLYALTMQLIKKYAVQKVFGVYNPYDIATNYLNKLNWFIQKPIYEALNLWNIFPQPLYANLAKGIIALSAVIIFFKLIKEHSFKNTLPISLLNTFLLLSTLVLSFLPNLLAKVDFPFHRCYAGLTPTIFLLILWAIYFWIKQLPQKYRCMTLTLILLMCCCVGGFTTFSNEYHLRAKPSHIEYQYFKNIIETAELDQYDGIHIIRPVEEDIISRNDEFGLPTTRYPQDVPGYIIATLIDMNKETKDIYDIQLDGRTRILRLIFLNKKDKTQKSGIQKYISSGLKEEKINFGRKTLMIDMTKLYNPSWPLHYLMKKNKD